MRHAGYAAIGTLRKQLSNTHPDQTGYYVTLGIDQFRAYRGDLHPFDGTVAWHEHGKGQSSLLARHFWTLGSSAIIGTRCMATSAE